MMNIAIYLNLTNPEYCRDTALGINFSLIPLHPNDHKSKWYKSYVFSR